MSAQVYVSGDRVGIDIYQDDIDDCFRKYGRLNNVWVARQPPGFAFLTYDDSRDADDAIEGMDGREIRGCRLRVERSRNKGGGKGGGGKGKDGGGKGDRYGDRGGRPGAPERTEFRVRVSGLIRGTNWRDLKDFLREGGQITYADVGHDGVGVAEFTSRDDMEDCIYRLDNTKFRGERVTIEKESRAYDFRRDGKTGREGMGGGGGSRGGDRRSRSRSRDRGRDRDRERRSPDGRHRDDGDDRGRDRRRGDDDDDRDRRRDESPPRQESPRRENADASPRREENDRSPRSDRE